jgi:hypothetical protein
MMDFMVNPLTMSYSSSDSMFQRDLFAEEDIVRWREEHARLVDLRHKIGARLQALDQMISGAEAYAKTSGHRGKTAEKDHPTQTEADIPNNGNSLPLTMHDAIVQVIRLNPKGLEPREISAAIRNDASLSPKIKKSHPNYLYTAIARLVAKNQIRKDGLVYKPVT